MQPIGPPPASQNIPPGDGSDHDETQLAAALEEIERQRLALETLLHADLFKYCLGGE
jgi:hypothetical protein